MTTWHGFVTRGIHAGEATDPSTGAYSSIPSPGWSITCAGRGAHFFIHAAGLTLAPLTANAFDER